MSEYCEVCGRELDEDNCYGEKDFPLCRIHHDAFGYLVGVMVSGGVVEREPEIAKE